MTTASRLSPGYRGLTSRRVFHCKSTYLLSFNINNNIMRDSAVNWLSDPTKDSVDIHQPYRPRQLVYNSTLEAVCQSPMIRLVNLPKEFGIECQIFAKCEFMLPGGSLKDRIGYRMIEELQKQGKIKPGDKLVEATSGNTGIGIAMAAAVLGYDLTITLPEKMSQEKVDVLKGLGARIIRTPTEAAFDSPLSNIGVANQMHAKGEAFFVNQYHNAGNPLVHYDQTGEEIVQQMGGALDAFVISVGTGGSLTGISRKLKQKIPSVKIVGVDPYGSILAQPDSLNKPIEGSYKVQGIGYDFIPKVCDRALCDKWYKVDDMLSFSYGRKMISKEGLLCGGSCGASLHGAVQFIRQQGWEKDSSKKVVILLADSVRNYITKYLSKQWCIENHFINYDELKEPTHPFSGIPLAKLNLKTVPLHEDITVKQVKQSFLGGAKCVALGAGKVEKVIFQNKFLQICILRGLKDGDSALACGTKDFVVLPEELDCGQVERIVERHPCVMVGKAQDGQVKVASCQDFMQL